MKWLDRILARLLPHRPVADPQLRDMAAQQEEVRKSIRREKEALLDRERRLRGIEVATRTFKRDSGNFKGTGA